MTQLQEAFLSELKSESRLTINDYVALYNKYSKLAIEHEENSGADKNQAKVMGSYYIVSILTDFVTDESLRTRIIQLSDHAAL